MSEQYTDKKSFFRLQILYPQRTKEEEHLEIKKHESTNLKTENSLSPKISNKMRKNIQVNQT